MSEIDIVSDGYRKLFRKEITKITPLPRSGSDRKYFRIFSGDNSSIGAHNPVPEENEAFIGFTKQFISKGLNVPEIYGYMPEKKYLFSSGSGRC